MNRGSRRLVQIGTGTVLGLLVAGLVAWPSVRGSDAAEATPPPRHVGYDIPLVSTDGTASSLRDHQGKWTFLFFGFTHCPDVCPVTLQRLAQGLDELDRRGATPDAPITVALVSVDPARDTPEALLDYLAPFGSRFVGYTGTPESLASLADSYGVIVQEPEADDSVHDPGGHESATHNPASSATSEIAHTARIFVLDPQGRWIDEIPPWPGATDMADALSSVMGVTVPS